MHIEARMNRDPNTLVSRNAVAMMISSLVVALSFCAAARGQSSDVPLAFEVASVHPLSEPRHVLMGFSSSGPRLHLEGYSRIQLIEEAYGLQDYQIESPPGVKRQDSVYYEVVAKAQDGMSPTRAEFRQMLQLLLAQRFSLRWHTETRNMLVYALNVGKKGPKLKRGNPDRTEPDLIGVHGRNQTIHMANGSMEAFAALIQNVFVAQPVVDRTGLEGKYDIAVEATPEFRLAADAQPEDVSIFTALQEQLGLKLERTDAAVSMTIIDQLDEPSQN